MSNVVFSSALLCLVAAHLFKTRPEYIPWPITLLHISVLLLVSVVGCCSLKHFEVIDRHALSKIRVVITASWWTTFSISDAATIIKVYDCFTFQSGSSASGPSNLILSFFTASWKGDQWSAQTSSNILVCLTTDEKNFTKNKSLISMSTSILWGKRRLCCKCYYSTSHKLGYEWGHIWCHIRGDMHYGTPKDNH